MTVITVGAIERRQVKLRDRVDHKPRKVIARQPVPYRPRHQEHLLPIAGDEVLGHDQILLNAPDGSPLCDNLMGTR